MGNPYVKIADPNIIDLASWQNLINTVNQHADSIAKLTNSAGLTWNPNTTADGSWRTVFDIGNQIIQYGRQRMNSDGTDDTSISIGGGNNASTHRIVDGIQGTIEYVDAYVYEETISFPSSFSSAPTVIATISRAQNSSLAFTDYTVTISNITTNDFIARVVNKYQSEITSDIRWFVNWVAIGPY